MGNKYLVTEELALLVKTLRTKNKVSSKELSAKIGKSASYLSKLESGSIKMIPEEELTAILAEITEGQDFYQDKLMSIARMLFLSTAPERMSGQLWFFNYDMVRRPLHIPQKLLDDLNQLVANTKINLPTLVAGINDNKEISHITNIAGYPVNQWIEHQAGGNSHPVMLVALAETTIRDILNGTVTKTNYITIYSLTFVLLKAAQYGLDLPLSPSQAAALMQETGSYLRQHEFHSLIDINRMFHGSLALDEQNGLLASFNSENMALLNQIINHFQKLAAIDERNASQVLYAFQDNLAWNCGFISKIIGLPFHALGHTSYSLNKQLLEDITELLEKYREKPEFEKQFEAY